MIKRILTLAAAGAASLGLALAVPAGATTHPNATSVCGAGCDDVSGELLGPSFILNATNLGGTGPFQGRKINLRAGSNSAPNEDFDIDVVGVLHQFCTASGGDGEIAATSYACLTLLPLTPSAPVFEANFTPNSIASQFCAGALAPTAGFKLRLERCGSVRTYFVEDLPDADFDAFTYVPLIYAADTRGSHPLVVTVREFGRPAHQVVLEPLNLTGSDGVVSAQAVRRPIDVGPFS
jgi:hypothetical protein